MNVVKYMSDPDENDIIQAHKQKIPFVFLFWIFSLLLKELNDRFKADVAK